MTRSRSLLAATLLCFGLGTAVAHADIVPINETGKIRLDGADRYEVSANISAKVAETPQRIVIVASGEVYADALAAGPVGAFLDAPILLVRKGVIPPAVQAELVRLAPDDIYLMGGPNTISEDVADELEAIGGADVTRFSGADRYAVAAFISRGFSDLDTIYIASGQLFSDALSAGPAAAKEGGAILLTRQTALPAATEAVLTNREPAKVVIVGGLATISQGVEDRVAALLPDAEVVRYQGRDRYEVAANVARALWPGGATRAFYASGEKFPDALAGTPATGASDAPILLTTATCHPYDTAQWTTEVAPGLEVLLGGPASAYGGTDACGPAPAYGNFPEDLDCADFASQEEAQAWFDYWEPRVGDVYDLDGDDDGLVCEIWPPQ